MLVATIDAQWEGMGDVGSARYELQYLVNFQKFSTLRVNILISMRINFFAKNLIITNLTHSETAKPSTRGRSHTCILPLQPIIHQLL